MILSENNEKFYYEDAPESEIYDEVVEIDDDFESDLSPEDNQLLKEIIDKNKIDLKFGAEYDIPIIINPQVIYFIRYFQTRNKRHFKKWIERSKTYIPYIRKILREHNMPEDLVFVSMIESGFSSKAYSRAGAVGPWQFMKETGKIYGLKINWWIDERRDLDKSTLAAIKYLKHLYKKFGDWYLAIAAYNAGEGKISRAIKRYNTRDYWELCRYRYIRAETKNYIPKMIAAALIMKNLNAYGFEDIEYETFPKPKVALIKNPTDLFKLAKFTNTTYKELKTLNPELKRWCTPPNTKTYNIKLPINVNDTDVDILAKKISSETINFRRHRVRYGESLWNIAKRYGTSISQIKKMNNIINSRRIRTGQNLVIPVRGGSNYYKKPKRKRHAPPIRKPAKIQAKPSGTIEYTVQRGDTLWSIASRFKLSPKHIREHNPKLKRKSSKIFTGEKIIIPSATTPKQLSMLPVSSNNSIMHTVIKGDNLYSIARKYNTSVGKILLNNDLKKDLIIKPGDIIKISK